MENDLIRNKTKSVPLVWTQLIEIYIKLNWISNFDHFKWWLEMVSLFFEAFSVYNSNTECEFCYLCRSIARCCHRHSSNFDDQIPEFVYEMEKFDTRNLFWHRYDCFHRAIPWTQRNRSMHSKLSIIIIRLARFKKKPYKFLQRVPPASSIDITYSNFELLLLFSPQENTIP